MHTNTMSSLAAVLALTPFQGTAGAAAAHVAHIVVDGAIGPATADYIARATQVAREAGAVCLILQLDTPGGLLDSTKDIVQTIYASDVPVAVFVAPPGASAASAGCFITLAADVAAMAPGTTIGAAHPVTSGRGELNDTMREKLANFAASYVDSIARKHGRNVEWARKSVTESASIAAQEAHDKNVVDLLATDLPALLAKLDGREVKGAALSTAGAEVREIPMLLRERVFQMLWRPEVMFLLMLVALYGIVGELSQPGAIVPGVAGVISLILALYLGAVLPVNIAGVALIVLAAILFTVEAFTPSFGLLTAGGAVAFFLGGLLLYDTVAPEFRLSWKLLLPATVLTIAFFAFVVAAGLRAQRLPSRTGVDTLPGRTATALTEINARSGRVQVEGESWRAVSATHVAAGEQVEILAVRGVNLEVKPKDERVPI